MSRFGRSRFSGKPSYIRISALPTLTVVLASMLTAMPFIVDYPILPPFGLLFLLAWRMIQPGHWPLWVGFPLGLIDDMFSGQLFGTSALIWSLVIIMIDSIDRRSPGRDYWQDWMMASVAIIFSLIAAMLLQNFTQNVQLLTILIPQLLLSVLIYPFVIRLISALDRWRLS